VWGQVVSDQVVRDTSVESESLIADLGARGVWKPLAMALFDIRVVDTDASLICPILLKLCWPQLKLRSSESIVMFVQSVVPPLRLCASQWIILLGMRLLAF